MMTTAFYDTHLTHCYASEEDQAEVKFIYLSIKFNIIDCHHIIVHSTIKQDIVRHMAG